MEGLSWTILKSNIENNVDNLQFDVETSTQHDIKLYVALDVLHECFVSIIEPRTRSDFVADLVFNRESELRRLNFYGFYTMLLANGDELISVATFRVYGDKVAKMPLVVTRVKFCHQGMCCLLVNEPEKVLLELGVERLVLPAVPHLLKTWTSSFGFSKMTNSDRLDLSEYTTLILQDTTMCCKLLKTTVQDNPKGDCKELMNLGMENEDSELRGKVSEALGMMEPIKALPPADADQFQKIDYENEPEHSPISICPNEQSKPESELDLNGVGNGTHVITVKLQNDGRMLLLCDHYLSSFHLSCLGLEGWPVGQREDVDWGLIMVASKGWKNFKVSGAAQNSYTALIVSIFEISCTFQMVLNYHEPSIFK